MLQEHWLRPFEQAYCYYEVDGRKTYNRNTAIAWANGNMEKIHLYWLDDVWESIDLTVRPTRSWTDLMRERCFQIRDKTTRLGLAFSGGYDSQTILDHFIFNCIRVDDIQINHKSFLPHLEFHSALETANLVKKTHYPDLNIKTIDVGIDYLLKIYQQSKEDWLWSESANEFKFSKQARASLVNYNYEHSSFAGVSARMIVEGHDKPRVFIHDGWWVMAMHDGVFDMVFNTPFENFYITRQLPELHLKQTWMMIDWLESQPFSNIVDLETFLHRVQKNLNSHLNEQWNLAVGRNRVRHVNSWDLTTMTKHSARGGLYSQDTIDMFAAHSGLRDLPEVKTWEHSALEFIRQYPTAFVAPENFDQFGSTLRKGRPDNNFALGKNIWTKKYKIKPVEPGSQNKEIML
jgi:hypothetical protein